jgi:hypothetical protein
MKTFGHALFTLGVLALLFVRTASADVNFQIHNWDEGAPVTVQVQLSTVIPTLFGDIVIWGPPVPMNVPASGTETVPIGTFGDARLVAPPGCVTAGVCYTAATLTMSPLVNNGGLIEEGLFANFPLPNGEVDVPFFAAAATPLYESVDLNAYVLGGGFTSPMSEADWGDAYQVVNGTIAGLPGVQIGTADMSLDPASGWSDSSPYTGTVYLEGAEGVCPEPSELLPLAAGLGVLACLRRRYLGRRAS